MMTKQVDNYSAQLPSMTVLWRSRHLYHLPNFYGLASQAPVIACDELILTINLLVS